MARKLKVIQTEDGEPAVQCPRCSETVQPTYYSIFDAYECPECMQAIDSDSLVKYLKAQDEFAEGTEE